MDHVLLWGVELYGAAVLFVSAYNFEVAPGPHGLRRLLEVASLLMAGGVSLWAGGAGAHGWVGGGLILAAQLVLHHVVRRTYRGEPRGGASGWRRPSSSAR